MQDSEQHPLVLLLTAHPAAGITADRSRYQIVNSFYQAVFVYSVGLCDKLSSAHP